MFASIALRNSRSRFATNSEAARRSFSMNTCALIWPGFEFLETKGDDREECAAWRAFVAGVLGFTPGVLFTPASEGV